MTTRRRIVAAIILTLALTAQTGCVRMLWTSGQTHGVAVETRALPPLLRFNFLLFRASTNGLYDLYRLTDIRTVQKVMWAEGQPPVVTIYKRCYARFCFAIGEDLFRDRVHGYIFDDAADLRTALIEARAQRNCLALTVFSNGSTSPNWTKKSGGCRTGSIPTLGGRATSPEAAATSSPLADTVGDELIDAGEAIDDRPLNAKEIARVHPDDRKYLNTAPEIDVPMPNDPNPVAAVTPQGSRSAD